MSKLWKHLLVCLGCAVCIAAVPAAAWAQASGIRLSVSRDWGFSMGKDIQGKFTLYVTGPDDLTSVTFYIDGQEMSTVGQPPFRLTFDTGSYAGGEHTLSATAGTADGQTSQDEMIANFVNGAQAWQQTQRLMVPLLAVVLGITLVGMLGSLFLSGRRRPGMPGLPHSYGPLGGAICPHCQRPLALSFLGINLVAGKLQRCPYCHKWGMMRRASATALAAAEAAETAAAQPNVPGESSQEQLRRRLEESRYQ